MCCCHSILSVSQVDFTDFIQPGDWVRLWVKTPFNTQPAEGSQQSSGSVQAASTSRGSTTAAGRGLLAAADGKEKQAAPLGTVAATSVAAKKQPSVAALLFDEPDLQAGVAAALEAGVAAQHAAQKVRERRWL